MTSWARRVREDIRETTWRSRRKRKRLAAKIRRYLSYVLSNKEPARYARARRNLRRKAGEAWRGKLRRGLIKVPRQYRRIAEYL